MSLANLLDRVPIEFERHQDAPKDSRPRLIFKSLTLRKALKLLSLLSAIKDPTKLVELADFLADQLVGWENQVDLETGEPIDFDRSRLLDVIRLEDLAAIAVGIQQSGQLGGLDQKKPK